MDVKIAADWKDILAPEFEKPYFASLTGFVRLFFLRNRSPTVAGRHPRRPGVRQPLCHSDRGAASRSGVSTVPRSKGGRRDTTPTGTGLHRPSNRIRTAGLRRKSLRRGFGRSRKAPENCPNEE